MTLQGQDQALLAQGHDLRRVTKPPRYIRQPQERPVKVNRRACSKS